jgi:hypothetical protein
MQKLYLLAFCIAAPCLLAGEPQVVTTTETPVPQPVPLDIVTTETAYIFESDLNHGGSMGKQDELHDAIEYGHRFLLSGNWYFHFGAYYERFDFGNTRAPVPVHLQAGAAVIGIDYMHGDQLGAFIQLKPGFYTEEHLGSASFDCPITIGRFWVLQPDRLYFLTGVTASFLSGGFPVIPLVGLVWVPSEQWRLMAVPPEPRLIYSVNKSLDLWLGGEFAGGSFRTDHHDDLRGTRLAKLSGAQVDFADYRAGLGLTYSPTDKIDVDLSGGYSIQRHFAFHRAGENYRTDPSPYVELEIKAKF